MAIQKKSLIGNMTAAKKAIIASNVASNNPVATGAKLETAKPLRVAKVQTAKVHMAKRVE